MANTSGIQGVWVRTCRSRRGDGAEGGILGEGGAVCVLNLMFSFGSTRNMKGRQKPN